VAQELAEQVAHPPLDPPPLPRLAPDMANEENFLWTLRLPQCGHFGRRFCFRERKSSSNALPHASHANS